MNVFIFVSLTAAAAMRRFEALLLLTLTICLSAASAQNNETATAAHEATRDGKGNRGSPQMISGYLVLMKTKFTDGSSITSLHTVCFRDLAKLNLPMVVRF